MGYADKSLAPGEKILYRARYHWIFYRSGLLVLFLAALLGAASLYASRIPSGSEIAGPVGYLALGFAVLALMLLGARWVRAQQDEFVVTDRRVLRSVGLVTREHEQAPIEKIQDITVTQSGLGRLLGYGDVSLETASERGTLLFPAIATPEAFRTAIWGRPRGDAAMGLAMPSPASPVPAASPMPTPTPTPTPSSRLEQLENLRRKGMVSEAEYAEKRREILAHL